MVLKVRIEGKVDVVVSITEGFTGKENWKLWQ